MAHNRKLVLGGVALTQAKLPPRQTALAMGKARDELEQEMIRFNYLNGAPFKWIGLLIREGLLDELAPHYQRIDKKDGELPISIELDVNRLIGASSDQAVNIYRRAILLALLHVGEKYELDTGWAKLMLDELNPGTTAV